MPVRPFLFIDSVSLSANGSGTLQYTVANGEVFRIKKIHFASSGTFNLTDIRTTRGLRFTNASPGEVIPSSLLPNAANNNNNINPLDPTGEIVGPDTLNIDVTDTSGSANTVRILLTGELETS